MKKWWLHTVACVINGITVIVALLLTIYNVATEDTGFSQGDGLAVFVFLLVSAVYITSDVWGLRLYDRYRKIYPVSFTTKRKVQVILFFLIIVQILIGNIAYDIARLYILNFTWAFEHIDRYWVIGHFILLIFLTSIIVFTGSILLLRSINKNKAIIKQEIENIGKADLC